MLAGLFLGHALSIHEPLAKFVRVTLALLSVLVEIVLSGHTACAAGLSCQQWSA